jgi:hypothetical protein
VPAGHTIPSRRRFTLELALRLLATASKPRTTIRSPLQWSDSAAWKLDYCNADQLSPYQLESLRAESDRAKETARAQREGSLTA